MSFARHFRRTARGGGILLASLSPRRREILSRRGLRVEHAEPSFIEEPVLARMEGLGGLRFGSLRPRLRSLLAEMVVGKADSVGREDLPLLAFDTVVHARGGILGKAADEGEARRMLAFLSGRDHFVTTVCLARMDGASEVAFHTTLVRFHALSARDVEASVATGEWKGAAGAYRIQEGGLSLVSRLKGDWHNVVGLPLPFLLRFT